MQAPLGNQKSWSPRAPSRAERGCAYRVLLFATVLHTPYSLTPGSVAPVCLLPGPGTLAPAASAAWPGQKQVQLLGLGGLGQSAVGFWPGLFASLVLTPCSALLMEVAWRRVSEYHSGLQGTAPPPVLHARFAYAVPPSRMPFPPVPCGQIIILVVQLTGQLLQAALLPS